MTFERLSEFIIAVLLAGTEAGINVGEALERKMSKIEAWYAA